MGFSFFFFFLYTLWMRKKSYIRKRKWANIYCTYRNTIPIIRYIIQTFIHDSCWITMSSSTCWTFFLSMWKLLSGLTLIFSNPPLSQSPQNGENIFYSNFRHVWIKESIREILSENVCTLLCTNEVFCHNFSIVNIFMD